MRAGIGLDSELEVGWFMLEDLESGDVFERTELIIERSMHAHSMTTLKRDDGIESGKKYDMRLHTYDVSQETSRGVVTLTGQAEVFVDDPLHETYRLQLLRAGLWSKETRL